eukprot:CAMPEP_0196589556 /NCGR_PEP_ID=MMETSP1081-20130531/63907_1 /TAXON_ID=36882 /ORGANISM="Pyramimonas amylifera, Strain CCMP720" /LENGTH=212 /DNA_ID=CAMNT_0041912399 /DNA_START=71 /DNA_END=706 /DNA_ORIENTATION=+
MALMNFTLSKYFTVERSSAGASKSISSSKLVSQAGRYPSSKSENKIKSLGIFQGEQNKQKYARRKLFDAPKAVKDYSAEHTAPSATEEQRWGYVIANAKFLLFEEEHLAELLRERKRMFNEKEREIDFFIVTEPAWLDALPEKIKSNLGRPAAAIVTTDLTWNTFMKLRLDCVHKGEFDAMMKDALASSDTVGEFKPPSTWTAPYNQYQQGW